MADDGREIIAILSAYITARDSASKRSPFYVAGNRARMTMTQFSQMIDAHHQMLYAHLPVMNVAGMELLFNYASQRLQWMQTNNPDDRPFMHVPYEENVPDLNLAEMEAFVELTGSRLNWMRPRGN